MSVSTSIQIPKTSDFAVFQRQSKVLFECVLNDPHVEEFGTHGQSQSGIDLLGRRREGGLDHWVGIQCKLKIKSQKLKTGPEGVVETEATSALTFEPALKEFIIATTASNDAEAQREAALFTDRQAKAGRDFTVQVWGWETLLTHILQHERALKAFLPDAFPQTDRLLRGQEKIFEEVGGIVAGLESTQAVLVRIESSLARHKIWDDETVDTLLDRQVDQFRNMLNEGRPRTALGLFEQLLSNLPEGAEGRIRFRIKANIAACHLRLGNEAKAAEIYLEAYQHAPKEPKAVALKVLALMLLHRPKDALAFGRTALTGGADQGQLVAYMITAAAKIPEEVDPLQLVTDSVANDPFIAAAKLDILRTRGQPHAWWAFAKESHARHPSEEILARAAAEANIDEVAQWWGANDRRPLGDDLRARVSEGTETLRTLLDKFAASEVPWDDYRTSLSVNLAVGYRLLRRHSEAKQIIFTALEHVPDDLSLKEALLTISLESGDVASARRALEGLPQSRDVVFARLQLAAQDGDWSGVLALRGEINLGSFETEDCAYLEVAALVAQAKLGGATSVKVQAGSLLHKYPDQPVVPTLLYEAAVQDRDGAWASELFQTAYQMRGHLNSATRLMLARVAEREGDDNKVIDLLDGYVDLNQDSDELRTLARAFVNAPVRQAAVAFSNSLPSGLRTQAFYARAVGSIHFNRGDLPAAAASFQQALLADRTDVAAHIGLINTWLRQDKAELVGPHLDAIDLSAVRGPPGLKMGLAQIFTAFQRADRGMSFGYDVAIRNRGDSRTVMLYIGLVLPDPTGTLIPSVGKTVNLNCWVQAARADGRTQTFVIEDGPDRQEPDHIGSGHPLAQLFIGQPKDAIVTSTPVAGTPETWRVVEFKHKYLALLHEFMEILPSRFPDAKGFYRFEIKGDDLSSVLDEVKRLGEQDEQILRRYTDEGFPLALVANLRGKSSVEFAGHVLGRGECIRTCVGTIEERNAAIRLVQEARGGGVVLDTYTAWVAQQLSLLGMLKALFARVVVPRSSIDELIDWRERMTPVGEKPLMTIGYANGQHFREEIPAERLRETVTWIASGIDAICSNLEVVPAAAPASPSELEQRMLDIGRHGLLDPIYVGLSEDLLLLSDDLKYRAIAKTLHGREGAWLQAAIKVALHGGLLDLSGYAEAVYGLAAQRHSHVTLDAPTLLQITVQDASGDLSKLHSAAAFIGNADADFRSHLSVSWEFFIAVWDSVLPDVRKGQATSVVLEKLVGMMGKHQLLKQIYPKMVRASRPQPSFCDHLTSWAKGHFLNV